MVNIFVKKGLRISKDKNTWFFNLFNQKNLFPDCLYVNIRYFRSIFRSFDIKSCTEQVAAVGITFIKNSTLVAMLQIALTRRSPLSIGLKLYGQY